MTATGITVLVGLLTLCLGMLLGATFTVQALDRQFRRLAIKRRELNALRLTLQESSARCSRCGNLILSAGKKPPSDWSNIVPGWKPASYSAPTWGSRAAHEVCDAG